LFGCASLWSSDVREAENVYMAFREQGHLSDEIKVVPTLKYTHENYSSDLRVAFGSEKKAEIPSLLRSYLKAGAKVCGEPAFDFEFGCFDYFVVMNLGELNKAFQERFS
jgi:putative hemolysin